MGTDISRLAELGIAVIQQQRMLDRDHIAFDFLTRTFEEIKRFEDEKTASLRVVA